MNQRQEQTFTLNETTLAGDLKPSLAAACNPFIPSRSDRSARPDPNPELETRNSSPDTRKPKPETRNPDQVWVASDVRGEACALLLIPTKPYSLHQNLETRNLKPETRNPKPETRNPKPETWNPDQVWVASDVRGEARALLSIQPKPYSLHQNPETRNPNPESRNPKPGSGSGR